MDGDDKTGGGPQVAAGASILLDLLALSAVLVALVLPDRPDQLSPRAFLTVPIEVVLGGMVLLQLPHRARRLVAVVAGLLLGFLTVLKIIDLGFSVALARPFDPVLDLTLIDDATDLLTGSFSTWGAAVAVVVTTASLIGLLVGLVAAMLRLTGWASRRSATATPVLTLVALAWIQLWTAGVQIVPGHRVASATEAQLAISRARSVATGLSDRRRFEDEAAMDAFAAAPGDQLLTALHGKDVMLVFVESYGRSAVDDPRVSGPVRRVLDEGTSELAAAGVSSRSAFLTSSTSGGGSWLAHGTLLSGLWVDNPARYRQLVASDRLTLTAAFARAGWRTVAVTPGTTRAWPEASFYGYQCVYGDAQLGYRGPSFSWAAMPDQYTLATFQRLERTRPHAPVMAVLPLVSSHAPWTPLPSTIGWSRAGDSATYSSMAGKSLPPEAILTRDPKAVRADYARAVAYSLRSVISFLHAYGDDDLVMIIVGDHQPSPVVTGADAGRDVPITVVAQDQSVVTRLAGWGWSQGLRPTDDAPVWRMDGFRDRFLAAFGPDPGSVRRQR